VRQPDERDLPHLDRIPDQPVIGWSISLPPSTKPNKRVEYVINTVKFREIYGADEEDEGASEDD